MVHFILLPYLSTVGTVASRIGIQTIFTFMWKCLVWWIKVCFFNTHLPAHLLFHFCCKVVLCSASLPLIYNKLFTSQHMSYNCFFRTFTTNPGILILLLKMKWNLGILLDPVLLDHHSFWRIFMILLDFVVHDHLLQIICQESHQVQALQAYCTPFSSVFVADFEQVNDCWEDVDQARQLTFWVFYFLIFFFLIYRVTAEQVVNCFKKYFLIWTKLTDPWLIYICHADFIVFGLVLKSFSFWICFFTSLIICSVIYLMSLANFFTSFSDVLAGCKRFSVLDC